eukprot:CAMPEP_0171075944 /NCGR_PEP_ID=MMETSP0766_2-20121228/13093_1 /TAXON_ID=439317 /ORGANISM="Gambierdiscus australes, Strain CAWD 149" /LENGTH=282 /DNA_ID=CAMNT_0011532855 /DNA_START=82 /DNA_END=930 /DNA_ORIENTATION=-
MSEKKAPPSFSEIVNKASKKALSGGIAGMAAQAINVLALMWMRTIMNYQYRYGGGLVEVTKKLWAEGGIPRFYRGLAPGLIQAPVSRFGDTAANDGALAALEHTSLPTAVKTMAASGTAAGFRVFLMPIDAWKTTKQVEGKDGLKRLIEKTKKHPTALWQGAVGAMTATWVGHYPWFYTNNQLREVLPPFEFAYGKYVRNAAIGFASAAVSDTCSNSLRVLKTTRQTALEPIGYLESAKQIIAKEGYSGLFGRGLKTRILTNGVQGALFTVGWKAIAEFINK